ncbi:hypothetical protein RvY_01722-2 [Ramazzottius varieornatus]|uniref:Uncharacterized protein n=1 Tax=Ramazzottius varieornatus TaxID=947166 RepID=A0A1D1UHI1_RAMVA|nr:hypothetical protein RvY_01722-2 [Ramazzottius varieornatus]
MPYQSNLAEGNFIVIKLFFAFDMSEWFTRENIETTIGDKKTTLRTPEAVFTHMYNVAQTLIDELFAPEKVTLVLSNINVEYKVFPGLKPGDSLKTPLPDVLKNVCASKTGVPGESNYFKRRDGSNTDMHFQIIFGSKNPPPLKGASVMKELLDVNHRHLYKNHSLGPSFDSHRQKIRNSRIRYYFRPFLRKRKGWNVTYRTRRPTAATTASTLITTQKEIWEVVHTV